MLSNLTPKLVVRRLQDLSLDDLATHGLEALLLDLDNTVCPWHSEEPAPGCEEWVQQATARFKVCMVSNSIHPRRLNRVADRLAIPAVGRWGLGRKPFPGGILAALQLLGVDRSRTAMIGDQIMTDVLGGNRLGLFTVWVQPLQKREFFGTKPSRAVERLLLRRFRRMGLLPEGS